MDPLIFRFLCIGWGTSHVDITSDMTNFVCIKKYFSELNISAQQTISTVQIDPIPLSHDKTLSLRLQ